MGLNASNSFCLIYFTIFKINIILKYLDKLERDEDENEVPNEADLLTSSPGKGIDWKNKIIALIWFWYLELFGPKA